MFFIRWLAKVVIFLEPDFNISTFTHIWTLTFTAFKFVNTGLHYMMKFTFAIFLCPTLLGHKKLGHYFLTMPYTIISPECNLTWIWFYCFGYGTRKMVYDAYPLEPWLFVRIPICMLPLWEQARLLWLATSGFDLLPSKTTHRSPLPLSFTILVIHG